MTVLRKEVDMRRTRYALGALLCAAVALVLTIIGITFGLPALSAPAILAGVVAFVMFGKYQDAR